MAVYYGEALSSVMSVYIDDNYIISLSSFFVFDSWNRCLNIERVCSLLNLSFSSQIIA